MSTSKLSIAILKSPGITPDVSDTNIATVKNQASYLQVLAENAQQTVNEMHVNRMKSLRSQLDYLKDGEWRYEPIEKYIGQTF